MLTAATIAAVLLGSTPVISSQAVSVIARAPAPAADTAAGETRRICRYERATGSTMQQRVCRDRPVRGVQDQQTREFMGNLQRMRVPDNNAAYVPAGPAG
ncbi:hypothetical protein GCM10009422_08590 [Brevundimonas kwangchunensis]|uniref:UrcA family protein n=1 Tax=Brevundimonas kwangchunensis TaxID=322163 RepID=A0ABN1GPH4_9CAUL